jgi:hypothetical protein
MFAARFSQLMSSIIALSVERGKVMGELMVDTRWKFFRAFFYDLEEILFYWWQGELREIVIMKAWKVPVGEIVNYGSVIEAIRE